jgi:predicted SAM-dependent methyltransferase/ADP-heptose:LPS heptosyltransferase
MVWSASAPQYFESAKVRYEVLPYLARGGLDIGCGQQKVWPHLIGIDNGKESDLFGVVMKPDIVVNDASRLAIFADGAAESIFSSHLLEHIDDWHGALREWWRLLKVNGYLCLYLPHADLYPNVGQPGANPDHKHDFRPEIIVDFCRLAFPDWALVNAQTRGEGNEYSFLLVFQKKASGTGQSEPWAMPKPEKTAGIVRIGGNGDALWAASVAAHLHEQGYSVTAYVAQNGEEVLRYDPHFAAITVLPQGILSDDELIEYWAHEAVKFDKWVNLIGSVETRLLPHQSGQDFYLPAPVRHKLMNHNYLDMVHAYSELPDGTPSRQKFYPNADEVKWAKETRDRLKGNLVVISPTGSGLFKAWPHTQKLMELLADEGIYSIMVGDLKHLPDLDLVERNGIEYGHVVGQEFPLRLAMTLCLFADAFVGTESVFANVVAMESMPKVMMLSHSSHENLTRDWSNTAALSAPVSCHPCHRIHNAAAVMCARDTTSGLSACMASYSAEYVADLVMKSLGIEKRLAA